MRRDVRWPSTLLPGLSLLIAVVTGVSVLSQQQAAPQFGGAYAALGPRRQTLVNDWVTRFVRTTGQQVDPGPFYDELLGLSVRTTYEAVTHALMTTALTDEKGTSLGDGLALVEQLETVRGDVPSAPGDRQFRIYVRLRPDAFERLSRSQQFKRASDNTVYHKGYPFNYRGSGVPSIQISIAPDKRRADVDVDYRSSGFPAGLFNGHLTSSNSDVRAGDNYDRHVNRWTGFQNWWRGFFGVRQEKLPDQATSTTAIVIPTVPRAGKKEISAMVNDFLTAWLVEGDVMAAMGYVSGRSYACLAQDAADPLEFDRGLAPFKLLMNLKSAHDSLGPHSSLEGLVVGTRLPTPGLQVINQPHHAQFVVYAVPDDVAAAFDCENRLTVGDPVRVARRYGTYFGSTFYIDGRKDYPVALLWAKDGDYWKIVSWRVGSDREATPPVEPAAIQGPRITADPGLVNAARGFLESWLLQKNYDAAFAYLSPKCYGCYDLERNPSDPAAASPEEGARRIRAALERSASTLPAVKTLGGLLSAVEPSHPMIRVLQHQYSGVFSLTSVPDALADAVECAARAASKTLPDPMPQVYGKGFGMTVRFKTRSGDAPVLRLLWRNENGAWKITSYGIEQP